MAVVLSKEQAKMILDTVCCVKTDIANAMTALNAMRSTIKVGSYTVHKDLYDKLGGVVKILERNI